MTRIANGQIVVTHDELAGKKPDGFAVYVRSTIKAGHREGEPVLYIELEAESNGTRMLFALSSPRLVAQIANSGIRVGGAYHMRVSGSSVAPNVTFEPLPATGPFPSDAAEPLRLDAEDVGVVAGVIARRTRHRIETITGMDFTEIDQALTATILISQLRDRSGIIRPTIAKEILEEERRMSTNERRTA